MYHTSFRCILPLACGTSTLIIRIGLNENSRFQTVRRSVTAFDRSKIVADFGASFGSYSNPGIANGSTSGTGPLIISSDSTAGGIVVTTPGAKCRGGTAR